MTPDQMLAAHIKFLSDLRAEHDAQRKSSIKTLIIMLVLVIISLLPHIFLTDGAICQMLK